MPADTLARGQPPGPQCQRASLSLPHGDKVRLPHRTLLTCRHREPATRYLSRGAPAGARRRPGPRPRAGARPCCSWMPWSGCRRRYRHGQEIPGPRVGWQRHVHRDYVPGLAVPPGHGHGLEGRVWRAKSPHGVPGAVQGRPRVVAHAAVHRHEGPAAGDVLDGQDTVERDHRPAHDRPAGLHGEPRDRQPCAAHSAPITRRIRSAKPARPKGSSPATYGTAWPPPRLSSASATP